MNGATKSRVSMSSRSIRIDGRVIRRFSEKGATVRRLAGDMPRFMVGPGGEVDMLTDAERALLRFYRALPEDLKPQYIETMRELAKGNLDALADFAAVLERRRHELVDW